MTLFSRIPTAHRVVFLASFAITLLFAVYTQHVWEDYYITYRASKNLATGHGLVFNHDDRLHTFTSPLGVLLPALASVLTLNQSDTVALWIFRLISAAAFAGATTLFYASVFRLYGNVALAAIAAAWLGLDGKSLDFTINGMETGLLLLFIAWTLWAQFATGSRRWLWLGLAWAGLMWTRPDSFLYIGLLAVSGLIFNDSKITGLTRLGALKVFLFAGMVCAAVYLPWFIGSWIYYGTPIPHTITAKSAVITETQTVWGALQSVLTLPVEVWNGTSSALDAFLPAYHMMGGWPAIFYPVAKVLAFVAAFAWAAPFVTRSTRAVSLTFLFLHVYLGYYPYFPFPWYLPGTTLLGYFVIAGVLGRIVQFAPGSTTVPATDFRWKNIAAVPAVLLVAFNIWATTESARQLAAQQTWIEDGNRRKVGEWLRDQSSPGDRVFLEPLGYIGFFSGLKTYDFPGMSSREVVDAVRRMGGDWGPIIDYLGPEWLVLRPNEVERVGRSFPSLLSSTYQQVREFNVREEILKLNVSGRPYLEFDSCFRVFRRERPKRFVTELGEFNTRFPVSVVTIEQRQTQLIHAPGTWIIDVPGEARRVHLAYGYPSAAHEGDPKTDGATFTVRWTDGKRERVLLTRLINPTHVPGDRGLQKAELELPTGSGHAKLELTTSTGATDTKDWTCWAQPEFW
jgi:hypothetical protein